MAGAVEQKTEVKAVVTRRHLARARSRQAARIPAAGGVVDLAPQGDWAMARLMAGQKANCARLARQSNRIHIFPCLPLVLPSLLSLITLDITHHLLHLI